MKPAPFQYHAANSAADAAQLLGDLGEDAKLISGGQSLAPMLAMRLVRFDHLVDISRVADLRGIDRNNGTLVVQAATPDVLVERSDVVVASVPLLTKVTPLIGHFQIRNRGTIGGSIAHADPAAEYPAVALALGAQMECLSVRGTRMIDAADYFVGIWSTSMESDELLKAIHFPVWSGRVGFGVAEFARRHGDFAIAGAVAAVELDSGNVISRCAIAMFGVSGQPERALSAESHLLGSTAGDISPEEVARLAIADVESPSDDANVPATYRMSVAASTVATAWTNALTEAHHG